MSLIDKIAKYFGYEKVLAPTVSTIDPLIGLKRGLDHAKSDLQWYEAEYDFYQSLTVFGKNFIVGNSGLDLTIPGNDYYKAQKSLHFASLMIVERRKEIDGLEQKILELESPQGRGKI